MAQAPLAYAERYPKARLYDQTEADNYIRHTNIGDPVMDSLMEELSSLPPQDLHGFIEAGIEQHDEVLRSAPQVLRDFFKNFEEPPWLDYEAFRPGVRAFNANVDLMLVAFVTGVLVEGFSTLIAKSFKITGRVASTKRRLQQNNRHMLEIFFPGGLLRDGDGWKLSTRIRFVHARIRTLLAKSDDWKHEAWARRSARRTWVLPSPSFPSACWNTRYRWGRGSTRKKKKVLWLFGVMPAISWGSLKPSSIPNRGGGKSIQDRLYVRAAGGSRFDSRGEYVDQGHSDSCGYHGSG